MFCWFTFSHFKPQTVYLHFHIPLPFTDGSCSEFLLRTEAEIVSILVIKNSNKSYSHMRPRSSSSSSSGLDIILADTFYSPKQKADSPSREQKSTIYVQWKAIKASPRKRKRCAVSVEQISCQVHYLFWDIILIIYETEQYRKWPQVLLMPTEVANRKAVSHQTLIMLRWGHDSLSHPVI